MCHGQKKKETTDFLGSLKAAIGELHVCGITLEGWNTNKFLPRLKNSLRVA
jgi:hypothetical protein